MFNKYSKKQKMNKIFKKPTAIRLAVLALALIVGMGFLVGPLVHAVSFQDQINAIKAENNNKQGQRNQLKIEADSLQGKIDALQAQISALEAQINENQKKSDDLQAQIVAAEAELARQEDLLGQNLKAMYVEGDISTLEMLATSNDLSEFVDKQQYRNFVKDQINETLAQITALKAQLKAQKDEVLKLIAEQQTMRGLLDGQRAEQAGILALNQEQRGALDAEIRANNSRISDLRRQQAAENARLFGSLRNIPDTSGYPWAGVQPFPNSYPDPWGMYKRQCVSYTAWKVWRSGRHMPYWGGHGNANEWDENAVADGIPIDNNPQVGDVVVSNSGQYGHVMYVEHVYDDDSILVSQYNSDWQGRYSEAIVSRGTQLARNLKFIHF